MLSRAELSSEFGLIGALGPGWVAWMPKKASFLVEKLAFRIAVMSTIGPDPLGWIGIGLGWALPNGGRAHPGPSNNRQVAQSSREAGDLNE